MLYSSPDLYLVLFFELIKNAAKVEDFKNWGLVQIQRFQM